MIKIAAARPNMNNLKFSFHLVYHLLYTHTVVRFCVLCFVGRKRSHTIVTCLECGEIKRFRINSQQLWSMRPEAWKIAPNGIVDNSRQTARNT